MNDPYHVYLDLDVINNDYENKGYPNLRFEETRNNPFLEGDSSEYFCSIVRFTIQTGKTLPVFIPRILVGQADVNLTIYVVSLRYSLGTQRIPGRLELSILQIIKRHQLRSHRCSSKTYRAHTTMCIITEPLLLW